MNADELFMVIKNNVEEVLHEVDSKQITANQDLEELGASSVDIAEIIILTIESLKLKMSHTQFAKVKTINDIIRIIQTKN